MKAAVLTGIKQIEIADVPKPKVCRDSDVLLKVEMVGVCGSDVHYYETGKIGSQVVEYPFKVGHECAATVAEIGSAVSRVKAGQRVVVEPAICCHECDQCLAGRENTCRNLKFLGCPGQVEGCLCEYIIMPEDCCFGVDKDFSFDRAVLCEPLAIGVYAAKQADVDAGTIAAVLGAGPVGLSCVLGGRAFGVKKFFVTEIIPERLALAEKSGTSWTGNPKQADVVKDILRQQPGGLDVVFECAGEQETIDQAIELLKPGGKLMLIGIPRTERISFIIDRMRRKEIDVVNVRRQNDCTQSCIDLISQGQIDPDFMVTHHFSLEQTAEAFDLVAGYHDGVLKAMIEL